MKMTKNNKLTKVWEAGKDWLDNSPRYTFEGRDPSYTYANITVVITKETAREYTGGKLIPVYFGHITNNRTGTADTVGGFKKLMDAKIETEKLFFEYAKLFPDDLIV